MGEPAQEAANPVVVNKFMAAPCLHIREAMVPTIHKAFPGPEWVFGDLQLFQVILYFTSDFYSYFSPSLGNCHLPPGKPFVSLGLFWGKNMGTTKQRIDRCSHSNGFPLAAPSHIMWQRRRGRGGSICCSTDNTDLLPLHSGAFGECCKKI